MAIDVAVWYDRYGPLVLRRCRVLLKDEELARDAMHEVFVQLVRRQDRIEERAPSSLMYRMATNISLNMIRSKKRRPEDADDELLDRIAWIDDAEGRVGARSLLDKLFGKEVPSTRTIAVLHLHDGLTLEEVANEVGMSVSGVRKRLRNLRKHLHEMTEAA